MITLDNVSYRYRKCMPDALDGITAQVSPGIYLLLGENGAGKTTLLHLIAGLLTPTTGTCDLDGDSLSARRPTVMRRVFFLSDDMDMPFATVNEAVRRHAQFYPTFSVEALQANLSDFGLTGDERLKDLSLGSRHKSLVAYALALGTEVLLLDEPANGLDIDAKKSLRRMIARSMTDDRTIIVSTHTVYDLEALFDGLLLLSHGSMLISRPTWQIAARLGFVTSTTPLPDALYQEPEAGIFRAIVKGDGDDESAVNYSLLYSAVMSDARDRILSIINTDTENNDTDR
ncbi:MAG: ABC transporter ATP-binding protein [Bacteroidales bacterium]|nr:ABC transporter ATP-binding protein [Bacteroidales bacterium]